MLILGELCEATTGEPRQINEGVLVVSKSF